MPAGARVPPQLRLIPAEVGAIHETHRWNDVLLDLHEGEARLVAVVGIVDAPAVGKVVSRAAAIVRGHRNESSAVEVLVAKKRGSGKAEVEPGCRSRRDLRLLARGTPGVDGADERLAQNATADANRGKIFAERAVVLTGADIEATDVEFARLPGQLGAADHALRLAVCVEADPA